MDSNDLFIALEKNFITYSDLKDVIVIDCKENFISLSAAGVPFNTTGKFVAPSTDEEIFVRSSVVIKLKEAQKHIKELFPRCQLEVVYGYRSLNVQTQTYEKIKAEIKLQLREYNEDQLKEEVHRFIAVPSVAGHPTGGAVDVQVVDDKGQLVDMGTKAQEFVKESYSFNPYVDKTVWLNRQKLRQAMLTVGFAPFDGEWWHFSYGDKEWAKYYNKPHAIYTQVNIDEKGNML